MKPGDKRILTVTGLGPDGEGTGPDEDRLVHVPGAFPGEEVEVRIENVARQRPEAFAKRLALRRPHPARQKVPCRNDLERGGRCTGCPLFALSPDAQRTMKRESLRGRHGFEVDDFVAGEPLGYRWSSKRLVFGAPGHLKLGSFARGSHRPADMTGCPVEAPAIIAAAEEIVRVANTRGVEAYDERTGRGDLRYVWLKTDGTDVLVTLVTASPESRGATILAEALELPVGIAHAVQPGAGNVVRGENVRLLRGRGEIEPRIAGVVTRVGPLGFLQPNPGIAARAYLDLVARPDGTRVDGELAYDLYAGAGVTTGLLREGFATVVPCESYPESAARLDVPPETAEAFLARMATEGRRPDLVVANPPRGGLGDAAKALAAMAPPRLHLMSCSPDALARDLGVLLAPAGPYRLEAMRAYDTLPQTQHVELVAWLVRA